MAYKILVSPRLQSEYEEAIEYYLINSQTAASKFIFAVETAYTSLAKNPLLRVH